LLYVRAADVEELLRRYRLRDDPDGNVALIVVPDTVPAALAPAGGKPVPAPAAVADLIDEGDARARSAGLQRLREFQQAMYQRGWLSQAPKASARGSR
jgi:hypothetical protein